MHAPFDEAVRPPRAGAPPLTYMDLMKRTVSVESLPGTFSSSNLLPLESVAVTAHVGCARGLVRQALRPTCEQGGPQ